MKMNRILFLLTLMLALCSFPKVGIAEEVRSIDPSPSPGKLDQCPEPGLGNEAFLRWLNCEEAHFRDPGSLSSQSLKLSPRTSKERTGPPRLIDTRTLSSRSAQRSANTGRLRKQGQHDAADTQLAGRYTDQQSGCSLKQSTASPTMYLWARKDSASLNELARILGRDYPNVYNDAKFLCEQGILDLKEKSGKGRGTVKPVFDWDGFDIAV